MYVPPPRTICSRAAKSTRRRGHKKYTKVEAAERAMIAAAAAQAAADEASKNQREARPHRKGRSTVPLDEAGIAYYSVALANAARTLWTSHSKGPGKDPRAACQPSRHLTERTLVRTLGNNARFWGASCVQVKISGP